MKIRISYIIIGLLLMACSQNENVKNENSLTNKNSKIMSKTVNPKLPTIGILIFDGVIINEVVAPIDVFSKPDTDGNTLFNVLIIAKENRTYSSAQGLKIKPDIIIEESPKLNVLVVPSSYHPENQTQDKELVEFIKEQNKGTDYIASHCAGAFLIGESGVADNKEIVTYVCGGNDLKKEYPNLIVANDSIVSVVEDGKFISSNGNLVSYIASLDLLEKMTSKNQRKLVEEKLLLNRLQQSN